MRFSQPSRWAVQRAIFQLLDEPIPTLADPFSHDDPLPGARAAACRPFTVAELDRMPDDGRRYELLDEVLVVSPRPTTIHQ